MGYPSPPKPWYRVLYIQVLIAVIVGILTGNYFPHFATQLQPLGDGFISLVKMVIAPIIFCTIVHGIASMGDLKKLGRVGVKTLFYFEIVSSFALVIGMIVANAFHLGAGFSPKAPDAHTAQIAKGFTDQASSLDTSKFLLHVIPNTFFGAFAGGDLLQVLFIAALTASAITMMKEEARKPILGVLEQASHVFFGMMNLIAKVAPLGALGAMAYTVGSYGIRSLGPLVELLLGFYLTAVLFVVLILGSIAWYSGFSIFRFLAYIKEELMLVIGTSSSETALPGLILKMERLGCDESTVGLVIPTGYSFNLDGTNIYMSMAVIFLANATNTPLDIRSQITILLVAMLSSKGASGVTGAGFVALAATLAAVHSIPIESLALLVGIDRFMSQCRSLTNLIGNALATAVISRWENEISKEQLAANLRRLTDSSIATGS